MQLGWRLKVLVGTATLALTVAALALLTVGLVSADDGREPAKPAERPGELEVVLGFGGLFLDSGDNSIVYVFMLDPTQKDAAWKAAERILGPDRVTQVKEVRVRQGQYSMGQLSEWHALMHDTVRSVEGVSWTDLNEGKNRIAIGVVSDEHVAPMKQKVAELGIPSEAVLIEVSGPVTLHILSPDTAVSSGPLDATTAEDYWTKERMDGASPAMPVLPAPSDAATGDAVVSNTQPDRNVAGQPGARLPSAQTGRLGGADASTLETASISATVPQSGRLLGLLTAGAVVAGVGLSALGAVAAWKVWVVRRRGGAA